MSNAETQHRSLSDKRTNTARPENNIENESKDKQEREKELMNKVGGGKESTTADRTVKEIGELKKKGLLYQPNQVVCVCQVQTDRSVSIGRKAFHSLAFI